MSYDLVFWRQLNGVTTPAADIYEELLEAPHVEGLAELDVDAMVERLLAEFPGAIREPNGTADWVTWVSEDEKQSFQAEWTTQGFVVSSRHIDSSGKNRVIDWAAAFGCPLYDPQTNERFDGSNR
jgi:hypothetical protein